MASGGAVIANPMAINNLIGAGSFSFVKRMAKMKTVHELIDPNTNHAIITGLEMEFIETDEITSVSEKK